MTASFLTETIHVSRAVLRGLEAISAQQAAQSGNDRPLTTGIDATADTVLREWLEAQPGLKEREAKIREFFKSLAKNA